MLASTARPLRAGAPRQRDSRLSPLQPALFLLAAAIAAGMLAHHVPAPAVLPVRMPGRPEAAPSPGKSEDEPPTPACVVSERTREETAAAADPIAPRASVPVSFAFLARPAELFTWPAPPKPVGMALPRSVDLLDGPELRAERVAALFRRCAPHPVLDAGNALLKAPELILDEAVELLGGTLARIERQPREDREPSSITSLILRLEIEPSREPLFTQFLGQWTAQERSYLANFVESRASTVAFEQRTEDIDLGELGIDQRKVLVDAVRRTYLARYKVQAYERLRDDAWYFDRWRGADLVVLPPLIGAYLYYRGLDKRFSLGPSSLRVALEPLSEWVERNRTFPVAAGLEWRVKGVPLGLIVSAGIRDGRTEIDFVGIGTGLAPARRALLQLEGRRDR